MMDKDNIELLEYSGIYYTNEDEIILRDDISIEIFQKIIGDIADLIRSGKFISCFNSTGFGQPIPLEIQRKLELRDKVTEEDPIIYLLEQEGLDLLKVDLHFEKIQVSSGEIRVEDYKLIKRVLDIKNKDLKFNFVIYEMDDLK